MHFSLCALPSVNWWFLGGQTREVTYYLGSFRR